MTAAQEKKPSVGRFGTRWGAPLGGALLLLGCGLGQPLPLDAALSSPAGIQLPGSAAILRPTNLPAAAGGSATSSNALAGRVAEIQANLAEAVARARSSERNGRADLPPGDKVVRRALLMRLVRIYEQQLSNLAELETAKVRKAELARQAQDWSGFADARPYSILLTDGLREGLQAEQLRMASDKQGLAALDGLITENRATLTLAEEKIRRLNEQLESAADPARITSWSWQRELQQIRSQVAVAAVALLELERQLRQENLAASRSHVELLQRQLIVAAADTRFTQGDLDKVLTGLEADRLRLERDLEEAETRHGAALAALNMVRQGAAETNAASSGRVTELLALRSVQLDGAVTTVRVLRLRLEAASIERTLWELRFAGYRSRQIETLRESEHQLQTLSKRAALWKDYFRQKLDTSATQVALEETGLTTLDAESEFAPLARERLAALRERDESLLSMYRCSERIERLLQRWNEDLQRDLGALPFGARVRNALSSTRSLFSNLWTFELFTAEDTITVDGQKISGKRSVTIGKIAGAILILLIGYWLTGFISDAGQRVLQRWLHVEPNQGQLIRRWMRATLVVALVVFSLVSVKIPLTVFAFAGGALAIGIGFGMQTVLKNVVSGLIILFERPFRVGDVLDVGGQKGTLTGIGLRASVLQLWDGTEALFPNSSLLENTLTNWTYSSRVVRFSVTLGVAYGSDTRRVVQLLEEIVARHGLVETHPKPQVFFTNFGGSTLEFELRFWVDVLKANPAQVSSDLRHMIVGTFAEHQLVIAFPQRDVHLETARPLQVELIPPSGEPLRTHNGPEALRAKA